MNPLPRGVHKNLNSRKTSDSRMANDLDNGKAEESPRHQQPGGGRLGLGRRLKNSSTKLAPSSKDSKSKGEKHHQHSSGQYEQEQAPESSWTGEFPTEFSVMQQQRQQQQQKHKRRPSFDISVLPGGASAVTNEESIDAAGGPTTTKPAPQHHTLMSMPSAALAAPARGAGNTICSSASFESHDQVEMPSITSPSIHQWTAARNRMGGAPNKMLSEKTINTIDTKGTMNTYATTGTGTHTAITADSTLQSSIVSHCSNNTASLNASLMDLVPDSPAGRMLGLSQIMREQEEQDHRLMMRQQDQDDNDDDHDDMSITDNAASPRPMDENDEDRMMRLAMEMSLREFEEEQQEHRTFIAMPLHQQSYKQQRSTSKQQQPSSIQQQQQAAPFDSLLMTRPTLPSKEEVQVRDRLTEFYRESSQSSLLTSATGEEVTEVLVENPHFAVRQRRTIPPIQTESLEDSGSDHNSPSSSSNSNNPSMVRQLKAARAHLSKEEADEIERALRDSGDVMLQSRHTQSTSALPSSHDDHHPASNSNSRLPPRSVSLYPNIELTASSNQQAGLTASTAAHLSTTEAEEIQRAIREADELENQRSIKVALQLQAEEAVQYGTSSRRSNNNNRGGVLARGEATPSSVGAHRSSSPPRTHSMDLTTSSARYAGLQPDHNRGWHSNGNFDSFQPHEDEQATATAGKLSFEFDADEDLAFVGKKAYNALKTAMDRQNSHGKGINRADIPELEKKRAIDRRVQLQITRAVNSGLIEKCNGIVKEGSESVVYHAEKGENSKGHDVAIKVFKRIREFRGRGDYQEGDPRYMGLSFRDNGSQEQLESWAEKEYRNMIRANRACVPVASPLMHKENVVFMRFMGKAGRPSPQLKELEVRTGSKTWTLLYSQIMVAVRRYVVFWLCYHKSRSLNLCNDFSPSYLISFFCTDCT
jgi:serine/threonine-protein kinase RIO1